MRIFELDAEQDAHRYAIAGDNNVHMDVPLSMLAVAAFSDGSTEFVADQLFPSVGVGKRSDKYYILDKGAFFRIPDALRAPKTKARTVQFDVSSDAYYCHNYALGAENALEDLANEDPAIRLRENSTNLITINLRRAQEARIANIVTSATNMGSGTLLTGTNKWNDYVNSDPIADVTTGHAHMRRLTGLVPNTALIDTDTLAILQRHPIMLDMYKYTSAGLVSVEAIAKAFKVDRIIEGKGIRENALEGGTSSMTNLWGNNCLLAHVEAQTGMQTRTLGLRYQWQPQGLPGPFAVERNTFSGAGTRKVEVIETGHWQDERVIARDLGYLIGTTL